MMTIEKVGRKSYYVSATTTTPFLLPLLVILVLLVLLFFFFKKGEGDREREQTERDVMRACGGSGWMDGRTSRRTNGATD